MFAVATFVLDVVLIAIGAFRGNDDHAWRYFLIVLAIAAVATAIVFWGIVPRIGNLAKGALILAILAAITLVVFWLGIPVIIAGGAALLALEARRAGVRSALPSVALAIAALTVAAAAVIAFIG